MNSLEHLEHIRQFELNSVLSHFNKPGRLLELGAGSGWQAKKFSELGHEVSAIDLQESSYAQDRVFPVIDYDGETIPFEDNTFDYVFSSNVLEHVSHIDQMNLEIKRVLKKEGLAIHILPSSSWRIWTTLTHYIWVIKKIVVRFIPTRNNTSDNSISQQIVGHAHSISLGKVAFPNTHGERGNPLTEIYYFNQYFWKRTFKKSGFKVISIGNTQLLYTGNSIFEGTLAISSRKWLSTFLGSSCHIYLLKNEKV